MNTSNAFRSHLMQQFASTARSQSRPPLAMMPWIAAQYRDKNNRRFRTSASTARDGASRIPSTRHGRKATNSSWSSPVSANSTLATPNALSALSLSSLAGNEEDEEEDKDASSSNNEVLPPQDHGAAIGASRGRITSLAQQFQNLIQTRRTTSHFETAVTTPDDPDITPTTEPHPTMPLPPTFWRDALHRAVECGRRAPNHKRTEPFTFKRMIAPSAATERLAEIAYHVTLQKPSATLQTAEKKQAKWASIPAFLVAMVESTAVLHPQADEDDHGMYQALPFVPPQTEREMEDYASTCAAVQNVLLSLHAEAIASKWATGPVIQTPAFRELVGATTHDRIVALVMIGLPKGTGSSRPPRPRRFRRDWQDFLQDL